MITRLTQHDFVDEKFESHKKKCATRGVGELNVDLLKPVVEWAVLNK